MESRRPEAIGKHRCAGRARPIVARIEQAPKDWAQPHHLEIRSVYDSRADLARLAETDHGEADGRKVAELVH